MPRVLVIAEHDGTVLTPGTLVSVAAAACIDRDAVEIAVVSQPGAGAIEAAARIDGVRRVHALEHAANAPYLAAVWAPQIAALARDFSHVLAPATTFGKDLLPRVAGLLNVGMLSDVVAIDEPYRFRRPVYAGNAIIRIAADPEQVLLATIRPTAFPAAAARQTGDAEVVRIACNADIPTHTRSIEGAARPPAGPDLGSAVRVVAGGRGVGSAEGFTQIARLAAALGAAVGASRAAVDAGWAPNELQVGQTGKIVAPELYIAVGISGAIQHLTGIRDAGTIVAINNDADAPICAVADIVLVVDLFEAVPKLAERMAARQS